MFQTSIESALHVFQVALSMVLLPWPWAWLARLLWQVARARGCASLERYRMQHERQIVATAWRKRPRPEPEEDGAVRVQAARWKGSRKLTYG